MLLALKMVDVRWAALTAAVDKEVAAPVEAVVGAVDG
jgi:hypothetical protein